MSAPAPTRDPRPPLAERLGLRVAPVSPEATDDLAARLAEAARQAHEGLEVRGLLPPDATEAPTHLELPRAFAELLALALATARTEGPPGHAALLELQYLEALPTERVVQLATAEAPNGWLFHTPLPWAALPRLTEALATFAALLEAHGVDPHAAWGAPVIAALHHGSVTLGELYATTYYGALQPMFRALPHDLVALAAEAATTGWAAVDRLLTGPLVHELAHLGRHRDAIFPPYLDEALAGYFGTLVYRGSAYPAPGDDSALVGWPWFSQVGQALVRAFGLGPVLRAHAGVTPWDAVLPAGLVAAFERLGWRAYRAAPTVHFHPDMARPDRWVKLIYAAARGLALDAAAIEDLDAVPWAALALPPAPLDREILAHALAAMALSATQDAAGSWRVAAAAPDGPVVLDFSRGTCTAPPRPGAVELAPAQHALPPIDRQDCVVLTLSDLSEGALARLADALLAGG